MTSKPQFDGELVRLGKLIKSSSVRNRDGNCTDVYSVTNSKGFMPSEEYFSKEVYSKELTTYKLVSRNMIAYNPSRINVGSVDVQDKANAAIVSPLYVVLSTDATRLIPTYLVRFLKSKSGLNQIAFQSIGTVRNNLKFDALCRMEMMLPSLETQNERLGLLGLIEDKIDLCDQQIAALSDLVKSRFVEMFGDPVNEETQWPRRPISEFCELRIGPFGSALHKHDYISSGHALVNPSHIIDGHIVPDDDLTISDKKYEEMEPYHLRLGDVVLGRRGEIGRCAVTCETGLLCGTGSMIVRPGKDCRPDYLQRVLSFPSFRDALERNAVGQTMKNLNVKIVENTIVALPSMEAQQEFAAFVTHIDKLRFKSE